MSLWGASPGAIGFVSGLGELIGYSMRYVFGRLTDKTKHYWPMVILGYVLDIIAVPALALVGEHGWLAACLLLVIQRMGKAIKKPAKDTVMSFAASQEGAGKSFGIQELLDQIGAFLGPVLLYLVMLLYIVIVYGLVLVKGIGKFSLKRFFVTALPAALNALQFWRFLAPSR